MHEGRMAGRTGRAVARPVRVARSHVPRVLLAAVALCRAFAMHAYALPGSGASMAIRLVRYYERETW